MLRLRFDRASQLITLSLLVLVAACVFVSPSMAQTPSFDQKDPVESLQRTNPTSDQDLVTLATTLQKARADTEISFHEYKQGVRFFRKNHPGFYGNFFGDPFFATYDNRYHRLVRKSAFASVEVNPQNSFMYPQGFLCHPENYDPAFGGGCRGWSFAASDFFILPIQVADGSMVSSSEVPNLGGFSVLSRRAVERQEREFPSMNDEESHRPPEELPSTDGNQPLPAQDTNAQPSSAVLKMVPPARIEREKSDLENAISARLEQVSEAEIADRIRHTYADTPSDARRTTRSRTETTKALEKIIESKGNGQRLSAEEKAEVASQLQRIVSSQIDEDQGRAMQNRKLDMHQVERRHFQRDRDDRPRPARVDRRQITIDLHNERTFAPPGIEPETDRIGRRRGMNRIKRIVGAIGIDRDPLTQTTTTDWPLPFCRVENCVR